MRKDEKEGKKKEKSKGDRGCNEYNEKQPLMVHKKPPILENEVGVTVNIPLVSFVYWIANLLGP